MYCGPRGTREKEINCVLVSPDVSAHRAPAGLCTHLARLVGLQLSIATLFPIDPSGRRFQFDRAFANDLHLAGQLFDLIIWWVSVAG